MLPSAEESQFRAREQSPKFGGRHVLGSHAYSKRRESTHAGGSLGIRRARRENSVQSASHGQACYLLEKSKIVLAASPDPRDENKVEIPLARTQRAQERSLAHAQHSVPVDDRSDVLVDRVA